MSNNVVTRGIFDQPRSDSSNMAATENKVLVIRRLKISRWDSQKTTWVISYKAELLSWLNPELDQTSFSEKNAHPQWKRTVSHIPHRHGQTCRIMVDIHPPHSPGLALCDFSLFPSLKKSLAGQKFEFKEKVIGIMRHAGFQKTYFSDGLKKMGQVCMSG